MPTKAPSEPPQHEEGTFRAGPLELFWQRWRPMGEPRAVIVAVHGHGSHSGTLGHVVEQLVPAGFAVYAFDLRGHGRSPGARGLIEDWSEYRDDLAAFLDHVRDLEPGRPLFLLGHSLGGLIVLDYAICRSEGLAGVIAISPALMRLVLKSTVARIPADAPAMTTFEEPQNFGALTRDPEVAARMAADPLRHGVMTAGLLRGMLAANDRLLGNPQQLEVPLLMMHGLADEVVPADDGERFFARLTCSDKERREYPQTLHNPHDDTNRAEVLADLESWLARHLP